MKTSILTKILPCAATALALCPLHSANAAVSSNDLAIIGADLTGDYFAWIALNDIPAGEVLYFTDTSYTGSDFINPREGILQYTVQAGGLSAGSITYIDLGGSLPAGYADPGATAYSTGFLNFSTSGDQLLIFQDNDPSDTIGFTPLWAVNLNNDNWNYNTAGPSLSELYPGLVEGVNALAVGLGDTDPDDAEGARFVLPGSYGGNFVGTADELRDLIRDEANWEKDPETSTSSSTDPFMGGPNWVFEGAGNITIIPEPSSMSLLFLGAVGFMLRRKRN